jgi:DNA-binding transcriptional LysR family regulator
MELTSFGQALLPHANTLARQADEAIAEIDALRGLEHGVLRIGVVASAAVMILPKVLDRLISCRPGLQAHIIEEVEDRLVVDLAGNTIDVAISGEIADTEDIIRVSEYDFQDCHSVIAAADHPLVERANLTLRDLHDQEWVMPGQDAAPRQLLNDLLEKQGIDWRPNVRVETRSTAAIKAMVAATRLLGWLPAPLFASEEAANRIRRISIRELDLPRRFYVYRRRQNFISPILASFLSEL